MDFNPNRRVLLCGRGETQLRWRKQGGKWQQRNLKREISGPSGQASQTWVRNWDFILWAVDSHRNVSRKRKVVEEHHQSISTLSLRPQNGDYTKATSRIDHQASMRAQQYEQNKMVTWTWLMTVEQEQFKRNFGSRINRFVNRLYFLAW